MKIGVVIGALLGCLMLCASGREDAWVGELRMELAWPWPPAEPDPPGWIAHLGSSFIPTVVMRRLADGSVRSGYVLVNSVRYQKELDEDAALALADGIAAFLKTGKERAPEHGIGIFPTSDGEVLVSCANGMSKTLSRELAEQVAAMIRETRKRSKAFIGADLGLRRDAIRKLEGPVLAAWSISFELGSMDAPELGGKQRVFWQGGASRRDSAPWFRFWLLSEEQSAPTPDGRISHELFEALGRMPDELMKGKTVRWEKNGQMLRAFVENRAIYYRPGRRVEKDVRISIETAQEAWKMMEKRDRLAEWLETEVYPGVEELLKRGND